MNEPTSPTSDDDIPPEKSGVEDISGRFLDDNSAAEDLSAGCSLEERRRIVDLQWLNSLLEYSLDSNKKCTNHTIDALVARMQSDNEVVQIQESSRVVDSTTANGLDASGADATPMDLRQDRSSVPRVTRRTWRGSLLSAAALMLISMVWWLAQPESAEAMVDRAMKAAQDSFDRVYGISIVLRNPAAANKNARLTVRGGDQFVFEHTGPLGRILYIGKNSREYWLIPRIGPVLVTDSEGELPQWLKNSEIDLPFLQLTTALRRMRNDYELKRLPAESLAKHGPQLNHIEATRSVTDTDRIQQSPGKIEIWSDRSSGIVQKMVLSWPIQDAASRTPSITFELIESHSPDEKKGLYEYVTYAPRRNVRHLRLNQ